MSAEPFPYPKLSDLPIEEQARFRTWLSGQTLPYNTKDPEEFHYYPWDYERWKAGKPVID